MDLCLGFIDLSKAFDIVNRDLLWKIMERICCPSKFVGIVRSFHTDIKTSVVIGDGETETSGVEVGVNLYLAAATHLFPTEKRFKDHIKKTMKSFGIDPTTLESSSPD